jgi:adenine-specific DNA-methyltransferase
VKDILEKLLLTNENLLVEGKINKNKVSELARKYDKDLLDLLISNEEIKGFFFVKTESALVFKLEVFLQFINTKSFLPDSYTKYKQAIGLGTDDGKLLSENREIVLNWPYKDCVLEGGQDREDTKRKEIFFNETLAPDEINRLLDKKVLTNFKKVDADGEHKVSELQDDDNLIIKGNNLIALHSLKKRFAGKVKLIYLDPPYNTGNDSFLYNDRFNHSTWLTFMKNRLEMARELLSEEGAIFLNIDDDEGHYLKLLADGIFGRENFINTIIWEKKYTVANDAKWLSDNHDLVLLWAKNKEIWRPNLLPRTAEMNKAYKNPDNHPKGDWKSTPLHAKSGSDSNFSYTFENGVTWRPPIGTYPRFSKERLKELEADNAIWFGKDGTSIPSRKTFLSELTNQGVPARTIWQFDEVGHNHEAADEIKQLGFSGEFDTPKPERLLQRVLTLSTNENDLVLDFFMGSATTQAVAMKMNRRFIGIEQMDYINTVSVERLKKVIDGEQGGISKSVNWQGGGSFVYAELKNDAQDFKNRILEADEDKVLELFDEARNSSFLSYRVKPEISDKRDFKKLSLAEQKQILSELVDNNNLYVNYSDIDDETYAISENEKKLNKEFYGDL